MERDCREIRVGIADWKVSRKPCKLITLGLGSCVGVAVWDAESRIGGLAHIMLPDSTDFCDKLNPAKFADLALPSMWRKMQLMGASLEKTRAKMAGGAGMFKYGQKDLPVLKIGERNVTAVQRVLKALGLRIVGKDTGGSRGRTMILETTTGDVLIRTVDRVMYKI